MKIELSKQELEVIECWCNAWDKSEDGGGLTAGLSYKDAFVLAEKLGFPEEIVEQQKTFCQVIDDSFPRDADGKIMNFSERHGGLTEADIAAAAKIFYRAERKSKRKPKPNLNVALRRTIPKPR